MQKIEIAEDFIQNLVQVLKKRATKIKKNKFSIHVGLLCKGISHRNPDVGEEELYRRLMILTLTPSQIIDYAQNTDNRCSSGEEATEIINSIFEDLLLASGEKHLKYSEVDQFLSLSLEQARKIAELWTSDYLDTTRMVEYGENKEKVKRAFEL